MLSSWQACYLLLAWPDPVGKGNFSCGGEKMPSRNEKNHCRLCFNTSYHQYSHVNGFDIRLCSRQHPSAQPRDSPYRHVESFGMYSSWPVKYLAEDRLLSPTEISTSLQTGALFARSWVAGTEVHATSSKWHNYISACCMTALIISVAATY